MDNKKPLVNIIEIVKKGLKPIIMPEQQADDPEFSLGLGDEVTITITARVDSITNEMTEDLFNFRKVILVKTQGGFLASVKKAVDVAEEKESEESTGSLFDEPLYEQAKKIVIGEQKASPSFLQRRMKIGYARAMHMIELLEERGVVETAEGAKDRRVLIGN
jgi:DNA segregation ATPase FtsK/SpoIIIE-like protein